VASTALLLGGPAEATQSGEPADGRSRTVAKRAGGAGTAQVVRTVTLDHRRRVLVDGTGRVTGLERAKGRERIPFSVRMVAGHTHVVPGDAELLLTLTA
jgi:hypothetical protein